MRIFPSAKLLVITPQLYGLDFRSPGRVSNFQGSPESDTVNRVCNMHVLEQSINSEQIISNPSDEMDEG